jgi:D-alanyl-D-alanine carboxypeptidase
MKDRIFMEVVATEVYRFKVNHINSRFRYNKEWYNTNKLLRRPGFLGIKTGITVTAGPCLATAYQFRSKVYITVLLRSPKVSRRFS